MQAKAQEARESPYLQPHEQKRYDYILKAARNVFVYHGTTGVTLTEFACAAGLAPATVRRYVCDIHHLFALVLQDYLMEVIHEVSLVPLGPRLFARRRAAYFAATRGFCNVPTPMHFLLLRNRFALPEDELETIESRRSLIASLVAGQHAFHILGLLDSPDYDLEEIEAAFAAVADLKEAPDRPRPPPPDPAPEPAPAPKPAPPPVPRPALFDGLDDSLANVPDEDLLPRKKPVAWGDSFIPPPPSLEPPQQPARQPPRGPPFP